MEERSGHINVVIRYSPVNSELNVKKILLRGAQKALNIQEKKQQELKQKEQILKEQEKKLLQQQRQLQQQQQQLSREHERLLQRQQQRQQQQRQDIRMKGSGAEGSLQMVQQDDRTSLSTTPDDGTGGSSDDDDGGGGGDEDEEDYTDESFDNGGYDDDNADEDEDEDEEGEYSEEYYSYDDDDDDDLAPPTKISRTLPMSEILGTEDKVGTDAAESSTSTVINGTPESTSSLESSANPSDRLVTSIGVYADDILCKEETSDISASSTSQSPLSLSKKPSKSSRNRNNRNSRNRNSNRNSAANSKNSTALRREHEQDLKLKRACVEIIINSNTYESKLLFQIYLARIFAHNVKLSYEDAVALVNQNRLLQEIEHEKTKADRKKKGKGKKGKKSERKKKRGGTSAQELIADNNATQVGEEGAPSTNSRDEKNVQELKTVEEEMFETIGSGNAATATASTLAEYVALDSEWNIVEYGANKKSTRFSTASQSHEDYNYEDIAFNSHDEWPSINPSASSSQYTSRSVSPLDTPRSHHGGHSLSSSISSSLSSTSSMLNNINRNRKNNNSSNSGKGAGSNPGDKRNATLPRKANDGNSSPNDSKQATPTTSPTSPTSINRNYASVVRPSSRPAHVSTNKATGSPHCATSKNIRETKTDESSNMAPTTSTIPRMKPQSLEPDTRERIMEQPQPVISVNVLSHVLPLSQPSQIRDSKSPHWPRLLSAKTRPTRILPFFQPLDRVHSVKLPEMDAFFAHVKVSDAGHDISSSALQGLQATVSQVISEQHSSVKRTVGYRIDCMTDGSITNSSSTTHSTISNPFSLPSVFSLFSMMTIND